MNILITGASRGIGYEIVKHLAASSSHKIIAVSRDIVNLQKLQAECGSGSILTVPFDIANGSLPELFTIIKANVSSLDVLINNAGALVNKPFNEITSEELHYVYNVNVFAPFRLIQSLLPLMGNDRPSHIVNISSMGGFQGSAKFPGLTAYSSSKAAIASLSECLAEELKDRNIRVNSLALGAAQTEMLAQAFPGYQAPLSAAQMARFIADFSLSAHNYINGKIIPVSLSTP
jgi:NAD(P)-dependent dehydrogenase (short-subunit alcohol dehydrogenase family)